MKNICLPTGHITRAEIAWAVKDDDWQSFRKSLKGIDTHTKLVKLQWWLFKECDSRKAQVQVINYVNALRRGGLL